MNFFYRHDSYVNQYPGQSAPPSGQYPNQQPGIYPQQPVCIVIFAPVFLRYGLQNKELLNIIFFIKD